MKGISTITKSVTPAMAQLWLTQNLFAQQRSLRPWHVQYLASLMRRGHFRAESTITFAVHGAKHYLVNGQHTLHAIVAFGTPVTLRIEDYPVATYEEIASVYASFDRNLTRSHADIYQAHDFATHYNLARSHVNALAATMPFLISGFDSSIRSTTNPLALALRNAEFRQSCMAQWASDASAYFQAYQGGVAQKNHSIGLRAAVAAVGTLTTRYQPAKAQTFWHSIAMDEGLKHGDPAYALLRFLYSTPAVSKRIGHEYSRYVASAWNAYWDGRSLFRLYARDLTEPILIAGTPHNGTRLMQYITSAGEPSWDAVAAR